MMKICGSEQGTMAKNERKLTPAEQKRKEQFALVCEEMERQGYRKTDLTIGVVKANLLALIVMLPFAVLSGAVVLSSYSLRSMIKSPITSLVLLFLFLALLLLTAVHEGIHALTWAMFGKDYWKSIRFGVIWKALTPYCTCLRPAKRGQYILGAAMPTLVLGISRRTRRPRLLPRRRIRPDCPPRSHQKNHIHPGCCVCGLPAVFRSPVWPERSADHDKQNNQE